MHCGKSTSPCRTIKHAVSISIADDEIHIDYARGEPYKECETTKPSNYAIELNKSISFFGINGTAVIQCKGSCDFFIIKTSTLRKTRIVFVNLVITRSRVAVRSSKIDFDLEFNHCLIKNVDSAIIGKGSTNCFLKISNSSFQGNTFNGIKISCINFTAHFMSSVFNAIPVTLQTNYDKNFKKAEVFISNCIFNGERKQMCSDTLKINTVATIVNITVRFSKFSNHYGICKQGNPGTLTIYDKNVRGRNATLIVLKKLIFENNHSNLPAIVLVPYFGNNTLFEVELSDSVFRNNSGALTFTMGFPTQHVSVTKAPLIWLSNNIFENNLKALRQNAATINFHKGRYHLASCRFLDNTAGVNLYAGVVYVGQSADVTFMNCYYENSQTNLKSVPVYSDSESRVRFKGNNTFNLISLKSEQAVFVHMPSTTSSKATFLKGSDSLRILCPRGYILNEERKCKVSSKVYECSYLYYLCRQCPPKTYSLNRGEFHDMKIEKMHCHNCPRGGQCADGQVTAKPNFWGYKNKERISFLACPPNYCCDKENCQSYDDCHGNRSGTLCGQCPDGMSESLFNTNCKANDECTSVIFWPLVSCFLLLYLLFFLYREEITAFVRNGLSLRRFPIGSKFKTRNVQNSNEDVSCKNNCRASKSSGFLKIIFYYYQIVHLFRNSVSASRNHQILGKLEKTFSEVFNLVVINFPSFGCPLQNTQPVEKIFILHSVGYCLLALIGFLYILTKVFKIVRKFTRTAHGRNIDGLESFEIKNSSQILSSPLSVRIASAFTSISLVMYSSSAELCLSLLYCVPVEDEQVLFIDGNIKCYQTYQFFLVAYVVFSILPFCLVPVLGSYLLELDRISVTQFCIACILPLPFCFFWTYLLVKNSPLRHNIIEEEFEFAKQHSNSEASLSRTAILRVLLGPFRAHKPVLCFPASFLPWEGFLIFRRLTLIIVLTFIHNSRLRMVIAVLICIVILISHMYVKPYTNSLENFMETLSLGTLVFLCTLTFVKALYQGEDFSSSANSLDLLNSFDMVENIIILVPLAIITFIVTLSLSIRLIFLLKLCFPVCLRRLYMYRE